MASRIRSALMITVALGAGMPGAEAAPGDIPAAAGDIRIATFNAFLNRQQAGELLVDLGAPEPDPQIAAVAEILQRVRPDIVLLNEFDYDASGAAIKAFQQHYLGVSQHGATAISYPHVFLAESNTGMDSGVDLNNDGKRGTADDAYGYGDFPGQYAMVLLSQYPIDTARVRTFQHFLWQDMPGALLPEDPSAADGNWYSQEALAVMRLSSKSHWDVPVAVDGKTIHILASHPTPPVFDGEEDRNGRRNHDEIRFWADYIDNADYIHDDEGVSGGLDSDALFVILGDENASPDEGDATGNPMALLLEHAAIQGDFVPLSKGGRENDPDNAFSTSHTASWKMRADYVLPSVKGLVIEQGGVFWPPSDDSLHRLTGHESVVSSDHRLVWLDLSLDE